MASGIQHPRRGGGVVLVNARHVKAVPGGKTDAKDCDWLADRLRHGLVGVGFISPPEICELRELTRYRQSLIRERTALADRTQQVFDGLRRGPPEQSQDGTCDVPVAPATRLRNPTSCSFLQLKKSSEGRRPL